MTSFTGAGWSDSDFMPRVTLYVGHLPGRRSVAVYIVRGSVMEVVAYCRSEDAARSLIAALERLGFPS